MKKLVLFLSASLTIFLTGCFETTEEITLNEDGTGTYVNINDMSKVIPIMKNMGAGTEQLAGRTMDTSFALGMNKESTDGLTEEEVALLKTGSMRMKMNMEEEKMVGTMTFPLSSINDIPKINKLAAKSMLQSLMSQMGSSIPPGMDNMPEPSSIGDYYTLEYEKGELKRKLNKDKYATVASDKYLSQIQEAGAMGIPITYTVVINLPRPAEKLEGKNAKLSEDKKKVTVMGTIDEFFDSPDKLEFKVKY